LRKTGGRIVSRLNFGAVPFLDQIWLRNAGWPPFHRPGYDNSFVDLPKVYPPRGTPVYRYRLLNSYPHDTEAFTQGLACQNGTLYESTGWFGRSSLRRLDLESGAVDLLRKLPKQLFGEGLAILNDRIYQLTLNGRGFVYKRDSFRLVKTFSYHGEGWGLACDGECLVMSNGSSILSFLHPETLAVERTISVQDRGIPIRGLNDLEFVGSNILANVYFTDHIAAISPTDGKVRFWIDLTGLEPALNTQHFSNVLNGIAFDDERERILVTGKGWPRIHAIQAI
jgi:glutamine cyclotransferase